MEKTGNSTESLFRQRRRPRAAWVKEVEAFRESGLTAEEYAAKKDIEIRTLKSWIRVLRSGVEAATKSATPTFLPLSIMHAAKAPSASVAVMIEVDLANGRRVRMHVRPDADFKRVSDLLNAVEGGLRC
jgi:hypothetical protein